MARRFPALKSLSIFSPVLSLLLAGCAKEPASPLRQRAYVWQREWTPAVSAATAQAAPKLDGLVVFGVDVSWREGRPRPLQCTVDWQSLRNSHRPVSFAMRIAPWPGPFDDGASTQVLVEEARALLRRAGKEHVECPELQVDFDCAQKKLAGYALWLKTLREAVKPVRFVITTLPAWLDEPAFPDLLKHTDGWVLQVHSAMPEKTGGHVATCDPGRARKWVAEAAKLHRPFEVALSTYTAQAGYDENGKLLGLALDGIQPAWPANVRIMQFDSDPDALVALVREWRDLRPAGLQGILWYRLPVATDQRNWRWPTFAAVIEGRSPMHHLAAKTEGVNPVDLSVVNDGEGNEDLGKIRVKTAWKGPPPVASEALPGWGVSLEAGAAIFQFSGPAGSLPPGGRRSIGWLRFENPPQVSAEVVRP